MQFHYFGVTKERQKVSGTIEAADEVDAKTKLRGMNIRALNLVKGSSGSIFGDFKLNEITIGPPIDLKGILIFPNKKYPFKDNEFDAVVSVDCIEHIPKNAREKSLREMLRISNKHIIITCPFTISKWDRIVLSKWPKSSATYKNIKEHYDSGIPQPEEIEKVFKNCKIRIAYGVHPGLEYYIKLMERNIAGKAFSRTALKIFMPLLELIKAKSRRVYFIEKK